MDAGLTVVVDEVGRLDDPDALRLLSGAGCAHRRRGTEWRQRLRLLVGGRRLHDGLAARLGEVLDADDLALTTQEVALLLRARTGDDADAPTVWEHTAGWPAGVAVAVALSRVGADEPVAVGDDLLTVDVRGPAARTTVRVPREIARLASLPLVSPRLVTALGGDGAWLALAEAGVPARDRGDGWWVVPDPVREALQSAGARPTVAQTRAAAREYALDGLVAESVALLLRADDTDGVAELLADLDWTGLDGLSAGELRALEEVVDDDAAAAHPSALLHLAWAGEHQAEVTLVARCLERLDARPADRPTAAAPRARRAGARRRARGRSGAHHRARRVRCGRRPPRWAVTATSPRHGGAPRTRWRSRCSTTSPRSGWRRATRS